MNRLAAVLFCSAILLVMVLYYLRKRKLQMKNRQPGFILMPVFLFTGYVFISLHPLNHIDENLFGQEIYDLYGRIDHIEFKEKSVYLFTEQAALFNDDRMGKDDQYNWLIIISYEQMENDYIPGDFILSRGRLTRFLRASNPGQFDEALYYRSLGVAGKQKSDSIIRVSEAGWWQQTLWQVRSRLRRFYTSVLDEADAGVIIGMILGDRSLLDTDLKSLYQQSGISHILAISGMHVAFVGLGSLAILKRCGILPQIACMFSFIIAMAYSQMTGLGASAYRALIMIGLSLLAVCLGRSYDLLTAISLSMVWLLLENPFYIMNAGFLMSYGAVLGIGTLSPILQDTARHQKLMSLLSPGISVTLALTPLTAWFYFEIPLYSVLLNLLITTFMSILYPVAFIGGILGCLWQPAGFFLMGAAHYILKIYEGACRIILDWPGARIITGRPEGWKVGLYFILISLISIIAKKVSRYGLISLLLPPVLFLLPLSSANLQVTFADVGQGDGILMQLPGKVNMLVDGGSTSVQNIGQYRLLPLLKYNGIRKVDYMFMTHADEDHISGLRELLENQKAFNMPVLNLVMPETAMTEGAYEELADLARKNGTQVLYMKKNDYIQNGQLSIQCLHPSVGFLPKSENAYSLVLDMTYGDFSMLLTGDLEKNGEQALIAAGTMRNYDILKVPHHGSKNSTTEAFLNQANPTASIISCGQGNRYGHPHPELLNRLNEAGTMIYQTFTDGAVTVVSDGEKMWIKTFLL